MVLGILLVALIAITVGFTMIPTVSEVVSSFVPTAAWEGTPLEPIVELMPFAFLVLIIVGAFWVVTSRF